MHGKVAADQPLARPLRILLLLSSLHGGGAERVAVQLMQRLDPARFDVRMGLLRSAGPYMNEVDMDRLLIAPDGDKHFNFDGPNSAQYRPGKVIGSAMRAPLAFRRMIRQARPDVVMSFLKGTNLIAWLSMTGLGREKPRWIAREGNNALAVIDDETPNVCVAQMVEHVTGCAYRSADKVLAISKELEAALIKDLKLDPSKATSIHNPQDIDAIQAKAREHVDGLPNRRFIVTAGRLEYQKGHEVLLAAYKQSGAADTHDLVILGTGSREAELRLLSAKMGLVPNVHFAGFQANPHAWAAAADLFVLTSRWEGFGNVVAEALACGTPVLSTDCDYGPAEIVDKGVTGELVPVDDVDAIAERMRTMLANPAKLAEMGRVGAERIKRFAAGPMVERYASLFEEVAFQPQPA